MPHSRGQDLKLSAALQNRMEELALSNLNGVTNSDQGNNNGSVVIARGRNLSSSIIERDDLVTIGDILVDPNVVNQGRRLQMLGVTIPAWPDAMGNSGIALAPIPPDKTGLIAIGGFCCASVNIISLDDGFAAADPQTPGRLRSSRSGEFKIVAMPEDAAVGSNKVCFVSFGHAHTVLWRYELNEASKAPATTSAKLVGTSGTVFAATISLEDPLSLMDDQSTGDKGWCLQIGNKFQAIQGPCS